MSPRDGDAYAIPPGVDARYATMALRAEGQGPISWSVDGRSVVAGEIVTAHIVVQ